jgi:hypothetical protein
MATVVPAVPFSFVGVGIGIAVRRALRGESSRRPQGFSALLAPRIAGGLEEIPSASDLVEALAVLTRMLDVDFEGSDAYRRQLDAATLTRHATGYGIAVDRSRAAPAEFDAARPAARLPVEATGHEDLRIWLHSLEGYLDELELLNGSRFPDPATLRITPTA